jgi:hypothetical protein
MQFPPPTKTVCHEYFVKINFRTLNDIPVPPNKIKWSLPKYKLEHMLIYAVIQLLELWKESKKV